MSEIYIDGDRQNKIFIRANPDIEGHGQVSQIWQAGQRVYLEAADVDIQPSEFGTTVPPAGEKFYIPWGSQGQVTAYPITETDARYRFAEWFRADKEGENRESFGTFNPLIITGNATWREFEKPQLIPTYQAQYRLIFEVEVGSNATISPSGINWYDENQIIPFTVSATQQQGRTIRVTRIGLYDSTTNEFIDWYWVGDLQDAVHNTTVDVHVPVEFGVMPDRPIGTRDTYIDPRDNEEYDYVKMPDGKFWMVENLRYDQPGSVCYDNDPQMCDTYGKLYSWQETIDATDGFGGDWRVPNENDFNALVEAIGGRGTAGKLLKSDSGWSNGGEGTDDYGFTLLPGGVQNWDGTFSSEGEIGQLFTSTTSPVPPDATYAMIEVATSDSDALTSTSDSKVTRRSVRLITDVDPNPYKPSPSKNRFVAETNEYVRVETSVDGTGAIDDSRNCDLGEQVAFTTTVDNPTNQTHRIKSVEQINSNTDAVVSTFVTYPITDIQTSYEANVNVDATWRTPQNNLRATWQEYVYLNGTTGSATTGNGAASGTISGDIGKDIDVGTSVTVTAEATEVDGRKTRVARFERTNASGTVQGSALVTYAVSSPNITESHTFNLSSDFRTPNNYIRAMFAEYVTVTRAAGTNASITSGGNANYDFGTSVSFTATPATVTGQNWTIHQIQRQIGTGTWETLTTRTTLNTSAYVISYTMNENWRGTDVKIRAIARRYVTVTRGAPAGTGAGQMTLAGASTAGTNYAVGDTVAFSVTVTGGTAAITTANIQWQSSSDGSSWSNISGATGLTYTLTVGTSNIWIRATAPIRTYTLTTSRSPASGWVTTPSLTAGGTYNYGTVRSVTAGTTGSYPIAGWGNRTLTFYGWSGSSTATTTTISLTMTADRSVTANYRC